MSKKRKPPVTIEEREAAIIAIFRSQPRKQFNKHHLAALSGNADSRGQQDTAHILTRLIHNGIIRKVRRLYSLTPRQMPQYEGRVRFSGGNTHVVLGEFPYMVFIKPSNTRSALDGDRVRVAVPVPPVDGCTEGYITEVLERADTVYTGITEGKTARLLFVKVDNKRTPADIALSREKYPDLDENMRVRVRVLRWNRNYDNPEGEIVEVLGPCGDNDTEMHAILAEYDLPTAFDPQTERAADEIPAEITAADYAAREDLRDIPTFTIDPADAKDFDDALSLRPAGEGLWEVGVHIADVSHYVTPDSPLDREARERSTSVYLVDRVVPMLPETLSNGLCSLRPHEEKLCFSAIFVMDENLKIHEQRFCRTVIRSDRRFTYEEAQEIIDKGCGELSFEITTLDRLARKMRARRIADGALTLDRREPCFELDAEGRPVAIGFRESREAHHLIEEFMLLANKSVARFCARTKSGRQRAMVFRVHDEPQEGKFNGVRTYAARFGYRLAEGEGKDAARSLNSIIARAAGQPEEAAILNFAVRSLPKAEYSPENIGHYGLGFDYYTHFTSPIRRYPDIMVHRLLARYLEGGRTADREALVEECRYATERETRAAEAERASIKYKIAEFMSERVGRVFEGHITNITDRGFVVELENSIVEGLVYVRSIGDDYYIHDRERMEFVGAHEGRRFAMGDKLRVKVKTASVRKRSVEFEVLPLPKRRRDRFDDDSYTEL